MGFKQEQGGAVGMSNRVGRKIPRDYISRPRLLDMMDDALTQELLIINSPPGYGATTLIADWCENRLVSKNVIYAWLDVDETIDDAAAFSQSLFDCTMEALGSVIDEESDIGFIGRFKDRSYKGFIEFCSAVIPLNIDLVIILDGLDAIRNDEVYLVFNKLLDYAPIFIHFILATKTLPKLSLTMRRAMGRCSILSHVDLALTHDECAVLLQQSLNIDLSPNDIDSIQRTTQGWLLGVKLIILCFTPETSSSTRIKEAIKGNHVIFTNFVAEALDSLSDSERNFVLKAAFLDEFNPSMSDSVFGVSDSSRRIDALLKSLFIVPVDESQVAVHRILCTALQKTALSQCAHEVEEVLARTSDWYMEHEEYAKAIRSIIRFRRWNALSQIVGKHSGEMIRAVSQSVWQGGNLGFEELSEAELMKNPFLLTMQANILLSKDDPSGAEKLIESAECILEESSADRSAGHEKLIQWIRFLSVLVKAEQGRVSESVRLGESVVSEASDSDPYLYSWVINSMGTAYSRSEYYDRAIRAYVESISVAEEVDNYPAILISSYLVSHQYAQAGRLAKAKDVLLYAQKKVESADLKATPFSGLPMIGRANVCLKQNRADEADKLLYEGILKIRTGYSVEFFIDAQILLATIRRVRRDYEGAQIVLEKAVAHALRHNSKHSCQIARCHLAKTQLFTGDFYAAQKWVGESEGIMQTENFLLYKTRQFVAARVLIAAEENESALAIIDGLCPTLTNARRTEDLIEANILKALAKAADDDRGAATDLKHAVKLACFEGYYLPFVEEAKLLAPLLAELDFGSDLEASANRDAMEEFVDTLRGHLQLARKPKPEKPGNEAPSGLDALTKREREVCHLLVSDYSYAEIASKLFISKSTVHAHCNSVYSKFNAHNRNELKAMLEA